MKARVPVNIKRKTKKEIVRLVNNEYMAVPRREDRAADAFGIGLEEHDFALVRRAEPRKFVSGGDGCSQSGRAAAYDGNLFHDVRV